MAISQVGHIGRGACRWGTPKGDGPLNPSVPPRLHRPGPPSSVDRPSASDPEPSCTQRPSHGAGQPACIGAHPHPPALAQWTRAQPLRASTFPPGEWADRCTCVGLWYRDPSMSLSLLTGPGAQQHPKSVRITTASQSLTLSARERLPTPSLEIGRVRPVAHSRCFMSACSSLESPWWMLAQARAKSP